MLRPLTAARMASAERRPQCAAERPHISAPYLHQEGVCGGRGGVGPLRAILVKLGEAGISDEDIPKHLDEKADELLKLRGDIARLKQGPPELASSWTALRVVTRCLEFNGATPPPRRPPRPGMAPVRNAATSVTRYPKSCRAKIGGATRGRFHGDWAYTINVRRPSQISRHRVTARVVSAMLACCRA
jgi:hypothetical protein